MRRRWFLKATSVAGVTTIAGCLGDFRTKTVGLQIDNQTGGDSDVSVVISGQSTTGDEKAVSVSAGEIKTVETSISSPGAYTVGITTDSRTREFTHSVEQRAIDSELQIVIVMSPDELRSYIQG